MGAVVFGTAVFGATGAAGADATTEPTATSATTATTTTTTTTATTTGATSTSADPDDVPPPQSVPILSGFSEFWDLETSGPTPVLNGPVLQHNDEIVVWINNHATTQQQFTALQTAVFDGPSPDSYDQSITLAPGFGSVLAPLYVQGRQNGSLPLTTALINASTGSSGNYADVGSAKDYFDGFRPYWPTDANTPPADNACPAGFPPGDFLAGIRDGQPWADANGNLLIDQVADATDTTGQYTSATVDLSGGYAGLCGNTPDNTSPSFSFPSGHTTSAYQAAIVLATLVPELGPELLARASEHGNNRLVLGVHSPLDIMGGRMLAEAAIASRWSQPAYVAERLLPARQELLTYLQTQCGGAIAACAAQGTPYQDDPYGGQVMPGGSAQIVTDRKSAVATFRERLSYTFAPSGTTGLPMVVPPGAENLLLTTFPSLTATQRQAVLAQTSLDSGYPLDLSDQGDAAWQRLDLAAAMSATVQRNADGSITVLSVGGTAQVIDAPPTTTPTTTTPTTSTTTTSTTTPSTTTSTTTTTSTATSTTDTGTPTVSSTTTPITIAPITFTAPVPVVVSVPTTYYAVAPVTVIGGGGGGTTVVSDRQLASTGAAVGAPLAIGAAAVGSGLLLITAVAVRRRPRGFRRAPR